MDNQYPLYPPLSEEAQKEAEALIESFKEKLKKAAEEVLSNFYCDIIHYIESDSWSNFRNQLLDGFCNYDNRKIQGEYDFAKIRAAIFKEYKEEIMKEMPKELVKENESLKQQLESFWERHI